MLMEGVATVEGVAHVVVAEVGGVAAAAPRVIAQPLLGVAVDNRRKAALVVFQRVVHGSSSVVFTSTFTNGYSYVLYFFKPSLLYPATPLSRFNKVSFFMNSF